MFDTTAFVLNLPPKHCVIPKYKIDWEIQYVSKFWYIVSLSPLCHQHLLPSIVYSSIVSQTMLTWLWCTSQCKSIHSIGFSFVFFSPCHWHCSVPFAIQYCPSPVIMSYHLLANLFKFIKEHKNLNQSRCDTSVVFFSVLLLPIKVFSL